MIGSRTDDRRSGDNGPMDPNADAFEQAVVVDRVTTARGEVVLRRRGQHHEIISNGVFLMDTRGGTSERLLVSAALAAVPSGRPVDLLIGGLGVGFSLDEAVRSARPASITVVEIEPAVIGWHRDHLAAGALDDPRVRVVPADLLAYLTSGAGSYDAICLDIDNGPEWTVTDDNRHLYGADGLALVRRRLRPGGVLAVWSAAESAGFAAVLREAFGDVATLPVPVARGVPDVLYVACQGAERRGARGHAAAASNVHTPEESRSA
jgi:spermidine synthase